MTYSRTGTNTSERYTPAYILEAVRACFGGQIDLDPASCEKANELVRALQFFSGTEDGLKQEWNGLDYTPKPNVWVNPPYGKGSPLKAWVAKAQEQFPNVASILMIVPAFTAQKWFHPLFNHRLAFLKDRVKFLDAEFKPLPNPMYGHCIVYMVPPGADQESEDAHRRDALFYKHFSDIAHIVQ